MELTNSLNWPYLIVQLLILSLYLGLVIITLRSLYKLQTSNWLKATWIIAILCVPFLGMLAYWLIGRRTA